MNQSHSYTFGIEEEFFLVDPVSRDLATEVPREFMRSCRRLFGGGVHEEMKRAQVETATPILRHTPEARSSLSELREGVGEAAASLGMALVAAGTHPFAGWRDHAGTDAPRYERLLDDFQIVGRRSLVCGLHVHVALPEHVDRVELMTRLMPWTPMLLALSTSSPFWDGRSTGLMSYRQAAYDEWPRSGIPDDFENEARYAEFVDLLARCGALDNGSFLWWAIRPSAKFPTLELRITDACTRIEDSLALASAFRCLVRAHVGNPRLGLERSSLTRRIIDENRWRAKRFGVRAEFIDESRRCALAFPVRLAELVELLAPEAEILGCQPELHHLSLMARMGTSADAQLAIYRRERDSMATREQALAKVVDWLAETTRAGASRPSAVPYRLHALHSAAGAANA
ncbi:MAG: carboxylate-amine ligase [Arenimonas sp.]